MTAPFLNRSANLTGPYIDMRPVDPNDLYPLRIAAMSLYIEKEGTISIVTVRGNERTLEVPDSFILPVSVYRVKKTGTTAEGIWAFVVDRFYQDTKIPVFSPDVFKEDVFKR